MAEACRDYPACTEELKASLLQAGLALRDTEWERVADGVNYGADYCPACRADKKDGHKLDCLTLKALADPTLADILKEHDETEKNEI